MCQLHYVIVDLTENSTIELNVFAAVAPEQSLICRVRLSSYFDSVNS